MLPKVSLAWRLHKLRVLYAVTAAGSGGVLASIPELWPNAMTFYAASPVFG